MTLHKMNILQSLKLQDMAGWLEESIYSALHHHVQPSQRNGARERLSIRWTKQGPKPRSKAQHLRRPPNEWRLAPAPGRKLVVKLYIHTLYHHTLKKLGTIKTLFLGPNDLF